MRLTPLDIQQKRFSRALRGYHREEVEAFLALTASAFEDLVKELHSLREELSRRDEEIASHRDLERTLQETLVTAQRASGRSGSPPARRGRSPSERPSSRPRRSSRARTTGSSGSWTTSRR